MKPLKVTLLIGLVAAGLMLGGCGSRSRTAARAICDKMVACGIPEGSDRQCILDFEDQLTYIIDVDYFVDCLDQTSCATLAADAVAHMRSATGRHFHPLPFGQYVEQLAYAAGVELDKILTFVGLAHTKSASSLDRAIPAAIRLAFNLGIPREFLKVYLKLSCLALAEVPTAQLARLKSASNNANASFSAIENEIEALAEKKGPSVLLEIRRRESEVDAVYDQEAGMSL